MSIKSKRIAAGISQATMAEKLKVAASTVGMWEIGKSSPRADMLPKIADILDCTVDELLRDGEKNNTRV